ncbi:hypothetical protein [Pinirhizobacter soli]|uniref:hypothetical protein n=1 Tax=Pinirhizobacter soli TaxID=2786953 RepID=UPI00202A88BD|nr:hypothetical protein [Pinirhizobacter soli]
MHTKFLKYGCLALGLMACGAVVASPANGTFAASGGSSSGGEASPHGAGSQSGSVHNPDDTSARGNAGSTHAPAPVGSDLPDDGTRSNATPSSAKPDVGWPALLPGSIW